MAAKPPTEVDLEITGLDESGLGEALVNERPAKVRNALPGELVRARIVRKRKGFRFADGISVEAESVHADRVAPACTNFPRCGGCVMHHMSHPAQLLHKQAQLARALEQAGVAPVGWSKPVSVNRLGYRRKARMGVRQIGEGVLVGFRESFSNRVARLEQCPVLSESFGPLIGPLRALIGQLSIADKIPQIELAQGDGIGVLMVRHLEALSDADKGLWRDFESRHRVKLLLQSGGYETLVDLDGAKPAPLGYKLPEQGLYLQFMPDQFTQVNLAMNRTLIRYMLAYLGGVKGKRLHGRNVADLFCGIGNLSLPLAAAGAKVWGYELGESAVEMAWRNARNNGLIRRTHFTDVNLYNEGVELPENIDVLVLDPPRSGAGPNLPAWLDRFRGDDCVYVSCNPLTFASDAACFAQAGFELRRGGIFDMFPHTAHVETVGHFRRIGS